MENPTPDELNQFLEDLSRSFLEGKRKFAAQILGQLTESNADVVQALAAAVATDSSPEVRSAAAVALQSPVHQDFIKNNPDLMQQAVEAAILGKQQKQLEAEAEIMEKFHGILGREKRATLMFLFIILAIFVLFFLFVTRDLDKEAANWILRLFQLAVFVSAGIYIWRSWRKYRCPSCGSWLGGLKASINVFWASSPMRCPHCGAKLL